MTTIDLDLLLTACSTGGPSCLSSTTRLRPAGGLHTAVAPAKYLQGKGSDAKSVYVYERRFLGGEPRHTVLIDSKQSQLNRLEAQLEQARVDGHSLLSRIPHVQVTYRDGQDVRGFTDLTLPHRVFDAHIRAGTVDGVPTTQTPTYRAVRDAGPANARALLNVSPVTLVLGGWDASRKSRQARWRSALVGEIVGFVPGGGAGGHGVPAEGRRGGARIDPVGMQMRVPGTALAQMAEAQRDELSTKTYNKMVEQGRKAQDAPVTAAELGFGGIPPALSALGGVACDPILRTHVLSFAALRQMRFGAGPNGDAACRALLAALALDGLARSDAELYLRANCDLVEDGAATMTLDQRGGEALVLTAPDIAAADALLEAALREAEQQAGVTWSGVALSVTGHPDVVRGAVAEDDEAS
ncbi:CRISPR-associated protein Csb1 [Geodermatophilus africanus]|uniref:CRISPR-associated protein Csb1 n=1 Tax=Geodermatophilus africanus TaxID=1137993 RepID=A0A1H3G780_9ACTN|nr:type I-U CRISPR-associated RAMP protein Csb1/Cas7u [Geodermatophilus africanus]SDX98334.1 CRISPR-associated protein Csb1 [Geodermatophilus africanus]